MNLVPYIFVEDCKKALEYYKDIFGAEIAFVEKADNSEKILHARLSFGDNSSLYLSDIFQQVEFGDNCTIAIDLDSEKMIQEVYDKMRDESKILMELQKTFWGATFAMVKDKFNVVWQLNYNHNEE